MFGSEQAVGLPGVPALRCTPERRTDGAAASTHRHVTIGSRHATPGVAMCRIPFYGCDTMRTLSTSSMRVI